MQRRETSNDINKLGSFTMSELKVKKTSILIVDDHQVIREGLRALLESFPNFHIVGEAKNGHEAIQLAATAFPQVIIMDVAMPRLNGCDATKEILRRQPDIKVLALTSYDGDEYRERMRNAGAAAFLPKTTSVADLYDTLQKITSTRSRSSDKAASPYIFPDRTPLPRSRASLTLTSREAQVLQMIAEGFANKSMAAELDVSLKTVEKHRHALMCKLRIHHTAGLTRYAIARGHSFLLDNYPSPVAHSLQAESVATHPAYQELLSSRLPSSVSTNERGPCNR
jgi:DNA-binding NarL/FixJ family response regulator